MNTMLSALNRRYSTKKFDPKKKIADKDLSMLLEGMRLAPSSFGVQPWKFIVIRDQAIKDELVQYARGQRQVADCDYMIVMCARTEIDDAYIKKYTDIAEQNGGKAEGEIFEKWEAIGKIQRIKDYYAKPDTAEKEVFLALGLLLTLCADAQIDACPIGGFEPEKFDAVLDLEGTGYKSVVCCAIGYRDNEDKYANHAKVRFALDDVVEMR